MFEEAVKLADERWKAGKLNEAIDTFESYIFIGPPEKFERMARAKMEELRAKML